MKLSTFIYFVNNFQEEVESTKFEFADKQLENYLATMKNAEEAPSDQTIENILNFARSYEVFETEKTGFIEMNLN